MLTLGKVKVNLASERHLVSIAKLRYNSFKENLIVLNKDEALIDQYDIGEDSINFLTRNSNDIINGAIRGVYYCPNPNKNDLQALPSLSIFYDEISRELGLESSIYESCKFVISDDNSQKLKTNLALIKSNLLAAYALGCNHIITAVRPKHVGIYKKMGMQVISEPKAYTNLNFKVVLVAGIKLLKRKKSIRQNFATNFKLMNYTEDDISRFSTSLINRSIVRRSLNSLQNHLNS